MAIDLQTVITLLTGVAIIVQLVRMDRRSARGIGQREQLINQYEKDIAELKEVVFPKEPSMRLLTLSWHDRIQADCERQRTKDLQILGNGIKEEIREIIREEIGEFAKRMEA